MGREKDVAESGEAKHKLSKLNKRLNDNEFTGAGGDTIHST